MVSVVIPVFNEQDSIVDTIKKLQSELSSHFGSFEIIVINDGSTDGTTEQLKHIQHITVQSNLINMGYGYSLKKGIQLAQHDPVLIVDGDSSYPLDNLRKMYDLHKDGFELVIASREGNFVEDSLVKNILRVLFRSIVEFSSGVKIPDVNSGLRIFSKTTCVTYFQWMSDRFSFTTSMTLLYALDKRMIYFLKNGYNKRGGRSKVKLGRDVLRTIQIIVEIIARKNPLKIHLPIIFFTISVIVAYVVFSLLFSSSISISFIFIAVLMLSLQLSLAFLAVQLKRK